MRAREIFCDSGLLLIALASVDFRRSKTNIGCLTYWNIEPIAVIVCSPDGTYALDMEAKLVAIDQLRQNFPELDAVIAPFNKAKNLRLRTDSHTYTASAM